MGSNSNKSHYYLDVPHTMSNSDSSGQGQWPYQRVPFFSLKKKKKKEEEEDIRINSM